MSRKTNYAFTGGFYSGAIRGGNIADIIAYHQGKNPPVMSQNR